jgi:hypothetical protein
MKIAVSGVPTGSALVEAWARTVTLAGVSRDLDRGAAGAPVSLVDGRVQPRPPVKGL